MTGSSGSIARRWGAAGPDDAGGVPAARAGRGQQEESADPLMSIGEVLGHLRVEFPDVSISKLRFLEAEGLVEPRRTPSGYRKYTWAEVHRLRFVLSAQRDHYLPLRVIREQLAAMDRGEAPAGAPSPRPPLVAVPAEEVAPVSPAPDTPPRVRRAELLERTGVAEDVLTDLERHGIVAADSGWYSADAIDVVTVAGALAEFGVTARHLRAYRTAADREVGLFAQLVAPLARSSNSATRARAAENVRELSALTQRLHAALVRIGLSDTLGR